MRIIQLLAWIIAIIIIVRVWRKAGKEAEQETEARRQIALAEQERKEYLAALKRSEIELFHNEVFPVISADSSIQSVWSHWPESGHDTDDSIKRQRRSLCNVTPVLIDTSHLKAIFYPTSNSFLDVTYETTLVSCSCPDFKQNRRPCKHIYRLFYELTHCPPGNPAIIDPNEVVVSGFMSLSPPLQYVFLEHLLNYNYSSYAELFDFRSRSAPERRFLRLDLLTRSCDSTEDDHRKLLWAMTKDQILFELTKQEIKDWKRNWTKPYLIDWVIETQPKFLKKYFKFCAYLRLSPGVYDWAEGVHLSYRATRYVPDEALTSNFRIYDVDN